MDSKPGVVRGFPAKECDPQRGLGFDRSAIRHLTTNSLDYLQQYKML